jgi:two-component system response regulator AtoC
MDTPVSLEFEGALARQTPRDAAAHNPGLLSEVDCDALHEALEIANARVDEILGRTYRLYVAQFGERRTLSSVTFFDIYRRAYIAATESLLARRVDEYAREVTRLGEELARRQVSFEQVVACCHLMARAVVESVAGESISISTYARIDKLNHVRLMLLATAYFRARMAAAGTRIRALEREARRLPRESRRVFHGLVGASQAMQRVYDRIGAAARRRGTVLLVGESGTGKELAAHAIHECGTEGNSPFVVLNCPAVPRELIESELFGYRRGAFSGALADYPGLVRAAEGGTLFLDEITEMSPETQAKLLRLLQERTIRPVGSVQEIPVNIRVIASTNRDPEEAVRSGQLRQDLYYRLQATEIELPPLRERREDIELLVEHFIGLLNATSLLESAIAGIEPAALEALRRYDWPGNVRELSNAIERAATFGGSSTIRVEHLPPAILRGTAPAVSAGVAHNGVAEAPLSTIAGAERELIRRTLEATRGNKARAARMLRISRKALYARMARYGLA